MTSKKQKLETDYLSEKFLGNNGNLYPMLYNNAPDAIYLIDLKGNFVDGNTVAEKMIGMKKSELIGKNMLKIGVLPKSQLPKVAKLLARNALGKNTGPDDFTLLRKDGSRLEIEIRTQPIKYNGKTHVLSIARDISEMKRRESKIKQNAYQRKKLLNIARELSSSLDLQSNYHKIIDLVQELLDSNGATLYLLSDDKQSLKPVITNDPLPDVIMSNNINVNASLSGNVVKNKHGMIFNSASQKPDAFHIPGTPDNEEEHLVIVPLIIEKECLGTLNVYRKTTKYSYNDLALAETFALYASTTVHNAQAHEKWVNEIKERKLAEEELQASRIFSETLLNASPDIIYIYDLVDRKNIYANKGLTRILGYSVNEVQKMGEDIIPHLMHPDDFNVYIKETIPRYHDANDGQWIEHEYRMKDKNGDWRWLHSKESIFKRFDNLNPKQIFGVVTDITYRKNMEDELKITMNKLVEERDLKESLINSLPGIFYMFNKKGQLIRWNKNFGLITEYTESEISQRSPTDYFTGNTKKKVASTILRAFAKGEATVEGELVTKSGRHIPYYFTGKRIKINKDSYLIGLGVDISHQKHIEIELTRSNEELKKFTKELQSSEERLRILFESAPDAYYVHDLKGNFIDGNKAAESMLGFKKEELIGKSFTKLNLLPPRDLTKALKALSRNIRGKSSGPDEYELNRKDGSTVIAEIRSHPIRINGDTRVLGIARDVTDRKKAEKEVQKLATVVKHSNELVNLATLDGKMIFLNEFGSKMLGVEPHQVENVNIMEVIPDHLTELVEKELLPTLMKKGTWEGDLEYRNLRTGKLTDVHAMTFTINDPDTGDPQFLANVSLDITERKKALHEAQNANKIKSNFLANMSHEIRTPLNAILGFTDLIENEIKKTYNPELDQYVKIIQQSGDRLMNTVHGILDISQIETGSVTLNPDLVDIKQTLMDLIASLKPHAQDKNLDLQFESHIRKSTIQTDKYCITQAMENIINNAIKYTDKGKVIIHLQQSRNKLIASVTDTGIGMSKEFMDRMFEPFTQESEGYTKKYEGVGLGLPLTKRYLDLIGAELKVESEKGKGSTFSIIFKNLK